MQSFFFYEGRRIMDSKIREIYNCIVSDTKFMEEVSWEVERGINQILKEEKKRMDIKAFDEYRDKFFTASALGEEAGFIKGFAYAAMLLSECFAKEQKSIVKP